jgi:hypothetical protein
MHKTDAERLRGSARGGAAARRHYESMHNPVIVDWDAAIERLHAMLERLGY